MWLREIKTTQLSNQWYWIIILRAVIYWLIPIVQWCYFIVVVQPHRTVHHINAARGLCIHVAWPLILILLVSSKRVHPVGHKSVSSRSTFSFYSFFYFLSLKMFKAIDAQSLWKSQMSWRLIMQTADPSLLLTSHQCTLLGQPIFTFLTNTPE